MGLIEGGEVGAPAQLGHRIELGRAIDDGVAPEELGDDVGRRLGDAVLPGGLAEIDDRFGRGDLGRLLEERDALAALLEDGLDLLVRVALHVGGHHDERLPVEIAALVRQEVQKDLARAHDEAALVVAERHAKGGVEEAVEAAAEVIAAVLAAADGAAIPLDDIDAVLVELAAEAEQVLGLVLEVGVDDGDELAARLGRAGAPGGGDAAVLRVIAADDDVGVGRGEALDHRGGAVGGAVVDDDELAAKAPLAKTPRTRSQSSGMLSSSFRQER